MTSPTHRLALLAALLLAHVAGGQVPAAVDDSSHLRLAGSRPSAARHHFGGWGASDYLSAAIVSAGLALPFIPGLGKDEDGDSRVRVRPMVRRPGLLWLIGLGR